MIAMWLFLHVLVVSMLAISIHWDLFGTLPEMTSPSNNWSTNYVRSRLLTGLVALGVTAASTLLTRPFPLTSKTSNKDSDRDAMRATFIWQTIFTALTLLSSILGIIAFYLDYIR